MRPGTVPGCWPWAGPPGSAGSWPAVPGPGSRARERQIKRQGGHARHCPLCGVTPRQLPRNANGSLSRSRTTDAQKAAAGVMTAAQLAEHTALRRGAITGKPPRPLERGPLADDPWAVRPARSGIQSQEDP